MIIVTEIVPVAGIFPGEICIALSMSVVTAVVKLVVVPKVRMIERVGSELAVCLNVKQEVETQFVFSAAVLLDLFFWDFISEEKLNDILFFVKL